MDEERTAPTTTPIARRITVPLPDDLRTALAEACRRDTRPPAYEVEVLLRRALVADGLLREPEPVP
jgi:hypothetical protein